MRRSHWWRASSCWRCIWIMHLGHCWLSCRWCILRLSRLHLGWACRLGLNWRRASCVWRWSDWLMLRRSSSWRASNHIISLWWLLWWSLGAYLTWVKCSHTLTWHSSLVRKRSRILTLHHWLWHGWFSRKWGCLWSNSTIRLNRRSWSHLSWLRSQSRFLLLRSSLHLSWWSWFFPILHSLFI